MGLLNFRMATIGARNVLLPLLALNLASCSSPTASAIVSTANTQTASSRPNTVPVQATYHFLATTSTLSSAQNLTQRHVEYTSASNAFITITVTPVGGSTTSYGPTSCTTASCTISFTAVPGPTNFNFNLTDATGKSLSSFSNMEIIQPATLNTFNFTANPVVNSVTVQLASSTITAGTPGSVLVTVVAKDIDGNIIIGNANYLDTNGNPLALSLSTTNIQAGGAGVVSLQGPLRITAPNQGAIYA